MKLPYILLVIISLSACQNKAKSIINESIKVHGGTEYNNFSSEFDFRKFHFKVAQQDGKFQYERTSKDSLQNVIHDILNNEGFRRLINEKRVELSKKDVDKYTNAVNSVVYFVLLPYKLQDEAVNSEYLGETELEGKIYDKVKVWFNQENGGEDFKDVYCYWFSQDAHTLDYLAYTNGGPRFRKVKKRQNIRGIIFQDYENYAILDTTLQTFEYDKAFTEGKASLLSIIEQTNLRVR